MSAGAGQAAPIPSLPLRIRARADYELEAGNLTVNNASVTLPRTEATLQGSIDLDGEVGATVRIESSDFLFLDQLFTQLRRFRGEQPVPQPLGLGGNGEIIAEIGGTIEAPTLEGRLTISAGHAGAVRGLGPDPPQRLPGRPL